MTGEGEAPRRDSREEGRAELPRGRCLSACFDEATVLLFAVRSRPPGEGLAERPRVREVHTCRSAAERASGGGVVGLRIPRAGFDALLRQAVLASFDPDAYPSKGAWRLATRFAQVTLTWVERGSGEGGGLAPCLALKGPLVRELGGLVEEIALSEVGGAVPAERPYPSLDDALWARLGAEGG